ncbi:MAG: tRNA preQ1(34) S-adenosylmethionine ribosyltransferase-isomerase QueA [Chitinophagales bacterium]
MSIKLSEFDFELPEDRIAEYPPEKRGDSKLMVIDRKKGTIEHKMFSDFISYFDEGDALIMNNTKVFPARLQGHKEKTGAQIEVFLLRELNVEQRLWDVLVDPARKIRVGNKLYFGENETIVAEVVDNTTSRGRTIRFIYDGTDEEFKKALFSIGSTPLPKYITRPQEDLDKERYQTVYAKKEGAVAAPTAGLHFTEEMMKMLEIKGIETAELTLHTGLGTFRTIDVEDLSKHKMDAEYFQIPAEAAETINKAKTEKRKICAIGTTSVRASESSATATNLLKDDEGWTNLFVFPPYEFKIADCLLTNFHLPKSSLLIMTSAFGGVELIRKAYQEAIANDYRFYSYGDAMLII